MPSEDILRGKVTYILSIIAAVVGLLVAGGVFTPDMQDPILTGVGKIAENLIAIVIEVVALIAIFQRRATSRVEKHLMQLDAGQQRLSSMVTPPRP